MAKASKVPSTEELLRQQIDELMRRTAATEKQNELLMKLVQSQQPQGFSPKIPLWVVIKDFLSSHGGSATPQEISEALQDRGHKLGMYPLRNVKITVTSPHVKPIFKIVKSDSGKEVVTLADRNVPYAPRSERERSAARKPASRTTES